jgi:predicted nucleotidyltransferase
VRVVYRRLFCNRAAYLLTVLLARRKRSWRARAHERFVRRESRVAADPRCGRRLVVLVAVLVTYAIALRKTRRTVLSMVRDRGAAETKTMDCGVTFKPQAAGSIPAGRIGRSPPPTRQRHNRLQASTRSAHNDRPTRYDREANEKQIMIAATTGSMIESAGRALIGAASTPAKVILFGSRARGDADERSDFDFLVIEDVLLDRRAESIRLRRALGDFGALVDLVVMDAALAQRRSKVKGTMRREGAEARACAC